MNKYLGIMQFTFYYLFVFWLGAIIQTYRLSLKSIRLRNDILDHIRHTVDKIPKNCTKEMSGALLIWAAVLEGFDASNSKPVLTDSIKPTENMLTHINNHAESVPATILLSLGHRQDHILPS